MYRQFASWLTWVSFLYLKEAVRVSICDFVFVIDEFEVSSCKVFFFYFV